MDLSHNPVHGADIANSVALKNRTFEVVAAT